MIPTIARSLVASTAVTSGGTSSALDLLPVTGTQDDTLRLQLDVSAIDPSTTLTVQVQTCDDNASWQNVGELVTVDAAIGATPFVVAPVARYVRVVWTLALTGNGAGPASATFALAGVSTRPYVNLGDLASQRVLGQVYASVSSSDLDEQIMIACGMVDDSLGLERYKLPLLSWPMSLKSDVLALVAWNVLSGTVGFNPEGDTSVRLRYTDAMKNIARAAYAGIVDSKPPYEDEGGIFVSSDPPRGWGDRWG